MPLTIDLTPEAEARLQQAAQRMGLNLSSYIGKLLAVDLPALPAVNLMDLAAWEVDLDELAAGSEDQPVLPEEAFSRENIYTDSDYTGSDTPSVRRAGSRLETLMTAPAAFRGETVSASR